MAPWLRLAVRATALSWSVFALPTTVRGEKTATPTPPSKVVFTNPAPISVVGEGPADLYPSVIAVPLPSAMVSTVRVTLYGVTHGRPRDLDVLLVGPTGIKVLLQSDAGGDGAVQGRRYTFDQAAGAPIAEAGAPGDWLGYRPGDYGGPDTFPAPAPPGPYGTSLADFIGSNPLGQWSLYVVDDEAGSVGHIATGWSLDILAVPEIFRKGDFNYDLGPDLVWRNDQTGEIVFWSMSAGFASTEFLTHQLTANPPVRDTRWTIVGTHDFNADRRTDLLFRHVESGEMAVWFMNGAAIAGGTFTDPPGLADTRWTVAGTGDFDGDTRPDILWRDVVSGQNAVWFMNGTTMDSGTFTAPAAMDALWTVAGVADFNLDHRADILWHHRSSGKLLIWLMYGAMRVDTTVPTPSGVSDTDWTVAAVTDVELGGWILIHWRHRHSGQIALWSMVGAQRQWGEFTIPEAVPDPTWRLVGPR
jgi:subtilisin-like proprotein convertase family protein